MLTSLFLNTSELSWWFHNWYLVNFWQLRLVWKLSSSTLKISKKKKKQNKKKQTKQNKTKQNIKQKQNKKETNKKWHHYHWFSADETHVFSLNFLIFWEIFILISPWWSISIPKNLHSAEWDNSSFARCTLWKTDLCLLLYEFKLPTVEVAGKYKTPWDARNLKIILLWRWLSLLIFILF